MFNFQYFNVFLEPGSFFTDRESLGSNLQALILVKRELENVFLVFFRESHLHLYLTFPFFR